MRISPEKLEYLLQLTGQKLSKRDTRFRQSIPSAESLTLILRFLASGDSQKSPSFTFRIGTTTVSKFIKETCLVLKEVLTYKFVKPPRCETDWLEIASDFEES